MNMKKLIFIPIIFLFLAISCTKDNLPPDNTTSDTTVIAAMARDSLYYIMKQWYYWYDMPEAASVTTSNLGSFKGPEDLLEAMRYQALDRWSFIEDYDKFKAQMEGVFVGHGFRIGLDRPDNTGKARIAMIYSNSPLFAHGVRRGWIVKTINGVDPAPMLFGRDNAAYNNLIRPAQAGITNIFVFTRPDGTDVTISDTKSTFDVNSVLVYDTLHLSTGVVAGHLVFESFIEPSENELATAFSYFLTNNVNDLIIDLRYNSGGLLSVAQSLASYIAGNSRQGDVFLKLKYNDKNPTQTQRSTFPFIAISYPLNLTRLVVITTRATASASETVINGLKPFLKVVTIGDTTDGKPTGMNVWYTAKKYAMLPVTFKTVNSLDQGDYFSGIYPAQVIPDDITHDFSDRRELCLKEAIYFLEGGFLLPSSKSLSPYKTLPQFSEKPEWMNNSFIFNK
jgi:carboxyl-terminal processing protease